MSEYYRYLKYQKYINGVPQDEYKQGNLIDTVEADSQSDCEQGVENRWITVDGYYCDGYAKYSKERKQKYIDGRWQDTSEYRKGLLIEKYSTDCGLELKYRWEPTGKTVCNGYDLYNEEVYQVSRDNGNTWQNVEPVEYRYDDLESSFNYDCVILTAPLELTIDSDSTLGVWINSSYFTESGSSNASFSGHRAMYIVDWGEGSLPIRYSESSYWSRFSMYKIPKHEYIFSGTYKIKIWGSVGAITDSDFSKPYTINAWGKGYNYSNDSSTFAAGFIIKNLKIRIYYDENSTNYLSYIEMGDNCLGYPELSDALTDNIAFECNSTKLTDLKFDFSKMWTSYLFINCPNLTVTPKLCPKVNGIPNAYKRISFEGCTKITETPPGGILNTESNDRIEDNSKGNYQNAFRGCTSLTKLNGPIIGYYADYMFKGCTSLTELNGLIKCLDANYMFKGCTGLTNLNNIEMQINNTTEMFKDLYNLTGQYTLSSYTALEEKYLKFNRDSMFENTKVSYVDPNMFSSILTNATAAEWTVSTKRMFYNTPVTKVSFKFNKNKYLVYDMTEMFSHSTANNIDGLFLDLLNISYRFNMYRMFENCNITNLEGVFNYNTTLSSSDFIRLMFKGCTLLTNYPTHNNYPIWFWPGFYRKGKLMVTNAFIGCSKIAPEVPPEWGGFLGDNILPMILSFTGEGNYSFKVRPSTDKFMSVYWGDGTYDAYYKDDTANHHYNTNEKHTITIYGVGYLDQNFSQLTDIEDFGTMYIPSEFKNVNSIGATHGQHKTYSEIDILADELLTKINPNFFNDCDTINKLTILAHGLSEWNLKLKDYMPNLNSIEIINVIPLNFEGAFEGLSKLLAARVSYGNIVNRAFKDCPKLYQSSLHIFKYDCLQADECFMNCISLKSEWTPLLNDGVVMINTLESAVRAYCNSGVINAFIQGTGTTRQGDCDYTEMYKDCKNLQYIGKGYSYIFNLDGTLNLTRCFENCTALTKTPELTYTTQQGEVTVKLWEAAGKIDEDGNYILAKNVIGTECFKGCTQLADYDEIPDDWK